MKRKAKPSLVSRAQALLAHVRGRPRNHLLTIHQSSLAEEFEQLCQSRLRHLVPVSQPLVLISQIQRSGGTLLSQLLDGHPQCHAHPYELYTGYPDKYTWPVLDLNDEPESWFDQLFEQPVVKAFQSGYCKYPKGKVESPELFPFLFPPLLQRAIFRRCAALQRPSSQRQVFDCFLTSYFNAWLDNHNLYTGPKKYITAFVPRLSMAADNVARFFAAYPDGRLLFVLRDPKSWYVSARPHAPSYQDLDQAIALWKQSTLAMLDAFKQYGERVYAFSFTELLNDTSGAMRRLAEYLGIDFMPGLLMSTFNGLPIKANSSFPVNQYGVLRAPLLRNEALTAEEDQNIARQTADLYAQALLATQAGKFAA